MNLEDFQEARCQLAEKQIVEGFCLSLDLLRQICLETGEFCIALRSQPVEPSMPADGLADNPS